MRLQPHLLELCTDVDLKRSGETRGHRPQHGDDLRPSNLATARPPGRDQDDHPVSPPTFNYLTFI